MLHALAFVWDIFTSDWRIQLRKWVPKWMYRFVSIVFTFAFLVFSGIYFKATSFEVANGIISKISSQLDFSLIKDWVSLYPWVLVITLFVAVIQFTMGGIYPKIERGIESMHPIILALVMVIIIFIAYQFEKSSPLPFYYLKY
jgi:hypothetical protein